MLIGVIPVLKMARLRASAGILSYLRSYSLFKSAMPHNTHIVKSLQACPGAWGIRTLASEAKYFAFAKFYFPWQYKVLRVDGASHWSICDRMPDV